MIRVWDCAPPEHDFVAGEAEVSSPERVVLLSFRIEI